MSQPAPRSSAKPGRRKGGIVFLLSLIFLTAATGVGAFFWKADLTVRTVAVSGNRILARETVVRLAAVPLKKRLEDIDLAAVRKRVMQAPYVKQASVHRDFPDRVLIRIEERVPIAALAGEKLLYVDAEGAILPGTQSELVFDLPVITGAGGVQDCRPGKRISHPTLREALQVAVASEKIGSTVYRRISEIHLQTNGELLLYTSEFGIPVYFGRGSIVDKLTLLEGFWTSVVSNRGGQSLRTVDVRFADQVVARWEPTTDNVSN